MIFDIRRIAELFDRNVMRYDAWYLNNIDIATRELELVRSFRLEGRGVEIGSGTCFFTKIHRYCIGIDSSLEMCKVCKKKYDIDVVNCVGELLPIRDSSIDYAMIIVTICFVDDYRKVIREVYRCLKDRSKLLICIVPRESSIGRRYVEKKLIGNTIFYVFARLFTSGEIVSALLDEGFIFVESRSTLCSKDDDCGFRCLLFTKSV
ncbi:MAG: class I SAM-dependent methyltransferase [Crenarchaeota archaeon]|nr:class I SAM-dependent methyltransferase [Thermoproteota archaeon]